MDQIENKYKDVITKTVEKIIAMKDGDSALFEDILGEQYDVLTLLAIGNVIESELVQHKIWLQFEAEDDYFQCRYKQLFQKRYEWLINLHIVYPKRNRSLHSGDNMIEIYTVFTHKKPTVNGTLVFCLGSKHLQASIHKDFSVNQYIDFVKLSAAIENIISKYPIHEKNRALLSKEYYGKTLIRINGVEYLLLNDELNLKEIQSAIGYDNMHDELEKRKNDGLKQGLYQEPSTRGEITRKDRSMLRRKKWF